MSEQIDCEDTDLPTCPFCGEQEEDWWETIPDPLDGKKTEVFCYNCEKEYNVYATISYSFSSYGRGIPVMQDLLKDIIKQSKYTSKYEVWGLKRTLLEYYEEKECMERMVKL